MNSKQFTYAFCYALQKVALSLVSFPFLCIQSQSSNTHRTHSNMSTLVVAPFSSSDNKQHANGKKPD